MSEAEVLERFKSYIEEAHLGWRVQTEIPVGDLVSDGRIVEIDENEVVKDIVCYLEVKGPDADLRELLTGIAQAQYYREKTLRDVWLVLNSKQVMQIMDAKKRSIGGIKLFDVENKKLIDYETVLEQMSKSSMKRAQERTIQTWSRQFTIKTTSPIAITNPTLDGEDVLFNIGARMRGLLKEIAKTISPSLAESIKYGVYVEPMRAKIAKKSELSLITKYIPSSRGSASKRELYEVPEGKEIKFTVRCIGRKLTPELIEDLILQGGLFSGIGDSHSDGFHGRFDLLQK